MLKEERKQKQRLMNHLQYLESKQARGAFLFSLWQMNAYCPVLYPLSKQHDEYAIYCQANVGPTFGRGTPFFFSFPFSSPFLLSSLPPSLPLYFCVSFTYLFIQINNCVLEEEGDKRKKVRERSANSFLFLFLFLLPLPLPGHNLLLHLDKVGSSYTGRGGSFNLPPKALTDSSKRWSVKNIVVMQYLP